MATPARNMTQEIATRDAVPQEGTDGRGRHRVLIVDDDADILRSLDLTLRRTFATATASDPADALEFLEANQRVVAIVSDMRMPSMSGVEFLEQARAISPLTPGVMLTADATATTASSAVNEGGVLRFLTKPVHPEILLSAVSAAVEEHRRRVSEKVLLEETLRGCVAALMEILALAKPAAFGRACRIRTCVGQLADELGLRAENRWALDVSTMLSQVGAVVLPDGIAEKLDAGDALTKVEEDALADIPQVALQLIEGIPRLTDVRSVLTTMTPYERSSSKTSSTSHVYGQLIRIAGKFDHLTAAHRPWSECRAVLAGEFKTELIDALERVARKHHSVRTSTKISMLALEAGMVLAEGIRTPEGRLLLSRGQTVTDSMLTRLSNYSARDELPGLVEIWGQ